MITQKEYQKKTNEQWAGTRVRSRHALKNGRHTLPKGTVYTIRRKFNGFELTSAACPCCGVQHHITRVNPYDLELVEEDDNGPT